MKYAAFDVGNVLVHADFAPFLDKLSVSLNITLDEALYFMNRNQKLHDLGLIKMADELHDHFKIKSPITIKQLVSDWNYVIQPAHYMVNVLRKLMDEHGVKIALLSNVGLEHAERMNVILSHDNFVDDTVKFFSCQVGARKPTMLYYHTFLQLYPEFTGCPYIDDLQENLDMGSQFGFQPFRLALNEITGANYVEETYHNTIKALEKCILSQPEPTNGSLH
jgi:FMN phosphatase YigB (HAD superfamily)